MNHPDILQTAATLKDLAEKVSKHLPFPCRVELDATDPDNPEIIINDWIIIALFLDEITSFTKRHKRQVIKYGVEHIVTRQSFSRDEPDDVDTVVDITVDRPCEAIKEAFKLLVINDLENAIDAVNEDEMIKNEQEAEQMMAAEPRSAAQLEAQETHRELFDPL